MALKIAFTGDNSNFIAAANEARNAVKALQTQVSKALDAAKEKLEQATVALNDSQKDLDSLRDRYNSLGKEIENTTALMGDVDLSAIYETKDDMDKTTLAIGRLNEAIEEQRTLVVSARAEQKKYQQSMQETQASGDKVGFLVAEENFNKMVKAEKEAEAAIVEMQDIVDELSEHLESQSEVYDQLTESIDKDLVNKYHELVEEQQNTAKGIDELNEAIEEQTQTVAESFEECKRYNEELQKLEVQGEKTEGVFAKLLGGQKNLDTILRNLSPQLQMAMSSLQGMTKAAIAFIATPLGMVLAALGLALKSLMMYFKGTQKGEEQFAKMTGYVEGVLQSLTNIAVSLGRQLSRLFTEPKQAAKDFGNLIKDNIITRIKTAGKAIGLLGDMFKDVFSADWDSLKEHAKEFGDNWLDNLTGVENTRDAISGLISETGKLGDAMADLNQRQYRLDDQKSKWEVEKQKLEAERAKLMESASEGNYEQRIAQMNKIISLNAQIAAGDRKIAQEQLAITKGKNALGDNNLDAERAEREAQMALDRVNQEEANANRRIRNQITTMTRAFDKGKVELEEVQAKLVRDLVRKQEDNEAELAQAEIDAMNNGDERVREQRKLNHKLAMREIERMKEDEIQAAKDAAKSAWSQDPAHSNEAFDSGILGYTGEQYDMLSEDDKKIVDNYNKFVENATQKAANAVAKYNKETADKEKQAMATYLVEYGDYLQQREGLRIQHEEKMKGLTDEGDINAENASYSKSLSDLDKKFANTADKIVGVWGTVEKRSKSAISSLVGNLKKVIEMMSNKVITDADKDTFLSMGFSEDFFNSVKTGETSIADLKDDVVELQGASDKLSGCFGSLGSSWDSFKETGDITEFINGLQSCANVAKDAASMVGGLAAAFGNKEMQETIQDVGNVFDSIFSGALTGALIAGPVGAAVGAITGLVSGLASMFTKWADADKVEQIEALEKSIKRLKKSYEDLETAVNKTYSKQRQQNIEQEIVNLQKQNDLVQEQIKLEQSKKDSDEDALESYRDTIYENQKRIRELREEAKDAIFGSDINSAIENFANAYADAWQQNTNRTKSAKEQVRQMMQDMIRESIKAAVESSGAMEKIREKLRGFYKDGILSSAEQKAIYDEAEVLQKELDKRFGWADDLLSDTNSFTQTGSSGGFTAMSQESADELNGRFAASQMVLENILQQELMIYAAQQQVLSVQTEGNETLQEVRNLMINVASNVEDIAGYTKHLTTFGVKFDEMNQKLAKL